MVIGRSLSKKRGAEKIKLSRLARSTLERLLEGRFFGRRAGDGSRRGRPDAGTELPLRADLCRSRAMLEGRCPAQTCLPAVSLRPLDTAVLADNTADSAHYHFHTIRLEPRKDHPRRMHLGSRGYPPLDTPRWA